jgi:hypothetical protein
MPACQLRKTRSQAERPFAWPNDNTESPHSRREGLETARRFGYSNVRSAGEISLVGFRVFLV